MRKWAIGWMVVVNATGCGSTDDAAGATTTDSVSADSAADAAGSDAAAAGTDAAAVQPVETAVCRYINPFSQGKECKAYTGPSWDAASAAADCAAPVPGAEGEFTAAGTCAALDELGACAVSGEAGKGFVLTSQGSNPDDCSLAQVGCEIFAKGTFVGGNICTGDYSSGGGGSTGAVFVQPYQSCQAPLPGEAAGQGPNGQVCTNVLVSGATEFGRRYQDYASCDDVRTQRPYWSAKPAKVTAKDDPRLQDTAYMAEVEWARQQLLSTACVCCHAKSVTPNGASNWDLEGEGIWLDHLRDGGLAMMAGLAGSDALGAYPPEQNNGYNRTALGAPTTDVERMRKLLLGEWARRGLTEADAEGIAPFGGPLVAQQAFVPAACDKGEGVDAAGLVQWQGGAARYVYVMASDSKAPVVPPNLDEPVGTLWFVQVPTKAEPMASGLAYGQLSGAMQQRLPTQGQPAALQSGLTYYLYVLKDIGVPVTRCLFKAL